MLNSYRLRTREARRNYYRLDLSLAKVQSRRWRAEVNYSYTFQNGSSSNSISGSFVNDAQTRYHYGPLLNIRPHTLTTFAIWQLPTDPWSISLSAILRWESGPPLERLYWGDQGITTGSYGLRIRPRGQYFKFNDQWTPSIGYRQNFDVRKGQIRLSADLLNMLNNRAPDSLSGFLNQENRLFAFSRQDPMRIQIGLAYEF